MFDINHFKFSMKSIFSLENKVFVVTGATGVLGKSIVEALAEAGAIVGVLGRNEKVAEERAALINKNGGRALPLIADVMNEGQLEAANEKMIGAFGRIDGLVNGAGGNRPNGVLQPGADIFKLDIGGMKDVLDLNLWGTLSATQIFGRSIARSGGGSIVNISSMTAQRAVTRVLGYSMAKAAVECYTKWFGIEMANRYGDLIRMNAIAPGFFITEQNRTLLTNADGGPTERGELIIKHTPFRRFGAPAELKGAIVWLLSDASQFVTGTVVNIDGGFSAFGGV